VTGRIVGDGSYFDPILTHPSWNSFDLNWWYAALSPDWAFTTTVSISRSRPGIRRCPPVISWNPDLTLFTFENRARTVAADSSTTIGDNFFRKPGTLDIWAEGTVSLSRSPWIESFALPDPNLYAARALEISLRKKGISVGGGAASTTDSMVYRALRCCGSPPPVVEYRGRPFPDIVFPILNSSQNWFAEMLLKVLAREAGDTGSWTKVSTSRSGFSSTP